MPSVRSLILLAVLILVVTLVTASLSLLRPPDSGGKGRDSYGTEGFGFRALYEVLAELGVEVRRQLPPPAKDVPAPTLALLAPDPRLVAVNPTYLQALEDWVRQGGRLLIAPQEFGKMARMIMDDSASETMRSITGIVGLEGVAIETQLAAPPEKRRRSASELDLDVESLTQEILEAWTRPVVPPRIVDVELDGELMSWSDSIHRLAIPGDIHHTLSTSTSEPTGTVSYVDEEGDRHVLVAAFSRGNGSIVVISEPEIISNRLLALADNSVLAARAMSPDGEAVVIDEFYHGLSVRGNPLYLLTRPGYAATALGLLLFVVVYSWREAVLLGPPLPEVMQQRRDIGEYLVAMGQFFSKGASSRPFLVRELRAGVLRSLCLEFSLPPETHDVDLIAANIARRDNQWGQRVRETISEVDAALESRQSWTESQTLNAMRRLTACL